MALSFNRSKARKRTQIVAIDLGARTSKAVHIQQRGESFELLQFAIFDAPPPQQAGSPNLLSEHLKTIVQALDCKNKPVALILSVQDSLLRHAELPLMPVADMRLMLKYSSKNYLQQDLNDYVFDCFVLPPRTGNDASKNQKCRVLVGAVRKQTLESIQEAAKSASMTTEQVIPNLIGAANAFEMAQPEVFSKETVAIVDIGFKNSTISVLLNGELTLSRVVAIGGDQLTSSLAEVMNISYPEAESMKLQMSEDIQPIMTGLLAPLGRELRASLDFFEKQEDKTVSQIFISGGSARSSFLVEALQSELMVPCKRWNPAGFLNLSLPARQMGEIEQAAPQLAVVIGGAIAAL